MADSHRIDVAALARYSKQAPRYTSYPTAVEFTQDFTYATFIESLARNDALSSTTATPLSIYVHLPFCRSACYFCGCNVIYTNSEEKKERYLTYLAKELAILSTLMDTHRKVVQLHFGGGTPTFLSPSQLMRVIRLIKATFPHMAMDAEISCEIDPRYFTQEHMQVLSDGGFNRLSFGVQDFDAKVQQAVNRFQDEALVRQAVNIARHAGITSINFDLIYGLPYQDVNSFTQTLEKVIALEPERLAVFNYAHVPWIKKTMQHIDENTLPSPSIKLAILQHTIDMLTHHGYAMIGIDHFAKTSDELYIAKISHSLRRNFQGYTTRGFSQTIGIGLTSIGEGHDYYAQNTKDLAQYERAIDEGRIPLERGIRLSKEDILRKHVIMELMNNLCIEFEPFFEIYHIHFTQYFEKEIRALEEYFTLGILYKNATGLYTTPEGVMLIRNIAMVFDSYLPRNNAQNTFSKSI